MRPATTCRGNSPPFPAAALNRERKVAPRQFFRRRGKWILPLSPSPARKFFVPFARGMAEGGFNRLIYRVLSDYGWKFKVGVILCIWWLFLCILCIGFYAFIFVACCLREIWRGWLRRMWGKGVWEIVCICGGLDYWDLMWIFNIFERGLQGRFERYYS